VGCEENVVRVSGGGAPVAGAMETPTGIFEGEKQAGEAARFGIAPGGASTALSSVQAGAHADLTTTFALDTEDARGATAGNLKNVTYDLPPGFAGDLVDTPACSAALFLLEECPVATQVGVTTVTLTTRFGELPSPRLVPVYNLAAEPGGVAKLGFAVLSFQYEGDVSVRAPGEAGRPEGQAGEPYGLKTTFFNSTAGAVMVDNVALTVWGVPARPVHDPLRWQDNTPGQINGHFGVASTGTVAPYLTNPTSCTSGPLEAAFKVTSWQNPNESEHPQVTDMSFGPLVGCDLSALWMEPKLTAETTSNSTGAATGLDVATNIRETYPNPELLATSTLKREVVTLPEGMTLNPSAGAGLAACTLAQYGEESTHELTGRQKGEGHGCPNASKLASVQIKTPSISEEATGSVFLAQPYENPFSEAGHPNGSLLAIYLIARAGNRGVLVKTPGKVTLDPVTGRITATFDGLPPLPFSLATFAFNQGANAPLVTPPACGNYTVTAELTPWADPEGSPLTPQIPPFPISSGVDGGACPAGGVPPFSPRVTAYPVHGNAGAYSPFYISLTRNDGEQEITGFASQLPPGLTGNLSGVPFCSEAAIALSRGKTGAQEEASPSCPAASQIGHTIAEAGVGEVLAQTPGKLYLAGPFEGAPFSVVAITSAHVGPFDLGTVVVHLPLDIDPLTAAVSIPAGPADQIPHIIKGIVIHVRNIRVWIDREDFMLNPTSCAPSTFSATVIGGGANPTNPAGYDPVTGNDPFQVAACGELAFKPTFKVSTSGKTSRSKGASLSVKLAYPPVPGRGGAPQGSQANIKSVKVKLPKQLPSRLTTLQKACTDKVFDANPAACPAASRVGTAMTTTPILPVALNGPVYFVSHGAAKFPELIIVLSGYGVTVQLHGETFISKAGITSTTFKTVPDVPVGTFELTLPEGQFSALAANGNLCKQKLLMPTRIVAQNGAVINQSTKIAVGGCAKPKAKKPAKRKKK
jgi:hypothetical protein